MAYMLALHSRRRSEVNPTHHAKPIFIMLKYNIIRDHTGSNYVISMNPLKDRVYAVG